MDTWEFADLKLNNFTILIAKAPILGKELPIDTLFSLESMEREVVWTENLEDYYVGQKHLF